MIDVGTFTSPEKIEYRHKLKCNNEKNLVVNAGLNLIESLKWLKTVGFQTVVNKINMFKC